MLRSKASPVTSPTSKAPGTSHQAQRSFLKRAGEATPATRANLLPALCSPASPPCLFLADLRQANTFHWNKTNAVKNLARQKGQTKLQEKLSAELALGTKFHWGSGRPPGFPAATGRGDQPPLGAGSAQCSSPLARERGCETVNTQGSKPAGLDVTPPASKVNSDLFILSRARGGILGEKQTQEMSHARTKGAVFPCCSVPSWEEHKISPVFIHSLCKHSAPCPPPRFLAEPASLHQGGWERGRSQVQSKQLINKVR